MVFGLSHGEKILMQADSLADLRISAFLRAEGFQAMPGHRFDEANAIVILHWVLLRVPNPQNRNLGTVICKIYQIVSRACGLPCFALSNNDIPADLRAIIFWRNNDHRAAAVPNDLTLSIFLV